MLRLQSTGNDSTIQILGIGKSIPSMRQFLLPAYIVSRLFATFPRADRFEKVAVEAEPQIVLHGVGASSEK